MKLGIGLGIGWMGGKSLPSLSPLTGNLTERSASGTSIIPAFNFTVSAISNVVPTGWLALSNGSLVAGATAADFETATTASATLTFFDGTLSRTASVSVTIVDILAPSAPLVPTVSYPDSTHVLVTLSGDPASARPITSRDIRYTTDFVNWTTVTGVTSPVNQLVSAPSSDVFVQWRAVSDEGAGGWSPSTNDVLQQAVSFRIGQAIPDSYSPSDATLPYFPAQAQFDAVIPENQGKPNRVLSITNSGVLASERTYSTTQLSTDLAAAFAGPITYHMMHDPAREPTFTLSSTPGATNYWQTVIQERVTALATRLGNFAAYAHVELLNEGIIPGGYATSIFKTAAAADASWVLASEMWPIVTYDALAALGGSFRYAVGEYALEDGGRGVGVNPPVNTAGYNRTRKRGQFVKFAQDILVQRPTMDLVARLQAHVDPTVPFYLSELQYFLDEITGLLLLRTSIEELNVPFSDLDTLFPAITTTAAKRTFAAQFATFICREVAKRSGLQALVGWTSFSTDGRSRMTIMEAGKLSELGHQLYATMKGLPVPVSAKRAIRIFDLGTSAEVNAMPGVAGFDTVGDGANSSTGAATFDLTAVRERLTNISAPIAINTANCTHTFYFRIKSVTTGRTLFQMKDSGGTTFISAQTIAPNNIQVTLNGTNFDLGAVAVADKIKIVIDHNDVTAIRASMGKFATGTLISTPGTVVSLRATPAATQCTSIAFPDANDAFRVLSYAVDYDTSRLALDAPLLAATNATPEAYVTQAQVVSAVSYGITPQTGTVPEGAAQGTDVLVFTPLTSQPTAGAITLTNVVPAGTLQMNADGRTLEVGATSLVFRVNPTVTFTANYTDAGGARSFPITLAVSDAGLSRPSVIGSPGLTFSPYQGEVWAGYDFRQHFSDPTGQGLTYGISPSLPGNISFASGIIPSVTPSTVTAQDLYTITVTNIYGETAIPALTFSLAVLTPVTNAAPVITTTSVTADVLPGTAPVFQSLGQTTLFPVANDIFATFDQEVLAGASGKTLTLRNVTDGVDTEVFTLPGCIGTGAGKITINAAVAQINPTASLANNKTYALKWDSGFFTNLSGIPVGLNTSDTLAAFITIAAAAAPTALVFSPLDNATGVALTQNAVLQFNMPVQFRTPSFTLRQNIASVWSDVETITATGSGNGQASITGDTLTVNPTASFVAGREYAIRMTATAVENLSGTAFAGIANDTTWSFTATAAFAQPLEIVMDPADRGQMSIPPANRNYLMATRFQAPLAVVTYLMGNGSDAYVRVGTAGFITWLEKSSTGATIFNQTTATAVITANTKANIVVLRYEESGFVEYRLWVNGTLVISGTVAATGNNPRVPFRLNCTSALGANAADLLLTGYWIGQAVTLPGTKPAYADFFSGALWLDVFTPATVQGFTATFKENGGAAAWNARTEITGPVSQTSITPDPFVAGNWSVAGKGVSGVATISITATPASAADTELYVDSVLVGTLGSAAIADYDWSGLSNGMHTFALWAINGAVKAGAISNILAVEIFDGAPVTSVAADGWQLTYPSPPTLAPNTTPKKIRLTRQGYDNTGTATTYTDLLIATQRIRQAYPNQTSLSTNLVSCEDLIYSTDTVTFPTSGFTNNSTETSPPPVANWIMSDHKVVGNTLHWEIAAFHRDARGGEPVACVEVTATDGTTTVTQKVYTTTISAKARDAVPIQCYQGDIDISTLANPSTVTLNAKVYPWLGTAGSVNDSSANGAVRRAFTARTFRRNTTLAASPVYVYVAVSGGNDTTGAVSTTAATAEASPCATLAGAINRAHAVNATQDGVIIRLMTGTHSGSMAAVTTTRTQTVGELIITRDPNATRAGVILQWGTSTFRPRLGASGGWCRFLSITLSRQNTSTFNGEAASNIEYVFDECDWVNNSNNAAFYSNCDGYFLGTNSTDAAGSSVFSAGSRQHRLFRGCDILSAATAMEAYTFVGNWVRSLGNTLTISDNTIVAHNKIFCSTSNTNGWFSVGAATQMAIVGNIGVYTEGGGSAVLNPGFRVSADSGTGSTDHVIIWHNTMDGFNNGGRCNIFYDETSGTARTHRRLSCKGNIHVQINNKGDIFASNAARVGNFIYLYGVGCAGEMSQFRNAQSTNGITSFEQAFPGLNANIGPSNTTRNDPLHVSRSGSNGLTSAGSNTGDYTLQSGSSAKNRLAKTVLKYDITGALRAAPASAGAYQ